MTVKALMPVRKNLVEPLGHNPTAKRALRTVAEAIRTDISVGGTRDA